MAKIFYFLLAVVAISILLTKRLETLTHMTVTKYLDPHMWLDIAVCTTVNNNEAMSEMQEYA